MKKLFYFVLASFFVTDIASAKFSWDLVGDGRGRCLFQCSSGDAACPDGYTNEAGSQANWCSHGDVTRSDCQGAADTACGEGNWLVSWQRSWREEKEPEKAPPETQPQDEISSSSASDAKGSAAKVAPLAK